MKMIITFMISMILSQSVFAGEVTGAGLTQMLRRQGIDVSKFKQQGLDVVVKKRNAVSALNISNIKYYVGEQAVYPAAKVNRVEFKPNRSNNFMWPSVESLEVNNQMLFPSEIKGFVVKKPARRR
jgi:hypothetical protein